MEHHAPQRAARREPGHAVEGQQHGGAAHPRGRDTKEIVKRNFGMPNPEGYRKALRLMRLAETLKSPIVHALGGKEHVEFENPNDVGMTGFMHSRDRLNIILSVFPESFEVQDRLLSKRVYDLLIFNKINNELIVFCTKNDF